MNSRPSILQLKTEWTISIQDIYKYRRISAILLGLVARHSSTVIEVQDWIANKNFDCMNNEIDAYLGNHIRVSSLHRIILRTTWKSLYVLKRSSLTRIVLVCDYFQPLSSKGLEHDLSCRYFDVTTRESTFSRHNSTATSLQEGKKVYQ